jgi:HAMP domain-containing protein
MRRRLFLGVAAAAVVTVLVGVVVLAAVRRDVRANAQTELFRQAEATAAIVAEEVEGVAIRPSDAGGRRLQNLRQRIGRLLDRARAVGGHDVVEAAFVVGGRIVPLSPGAAVLEQIPADIAVREVVSVTVDETPMLATVRRIPLDPGDLIIAIGRVEPLLPVQALTRSLLVAVGAGTILLLILGSWFSRGVVRRLSGLESASKAVASGDLEARAPTTRSRGCRSPSTRWPGNSTARGAANATS